MFTPQGNQLHKPESTAFKRYFYGILLLGIILRVLCLIFNSDISRDGIVYLQQSEILAQTGWNDFFKIEDAVRLRPPLYLSLIACGINFGLPAKTTGMAIAMICGIVLPVVIQKLAWELSRDAEFSLWNMLIAACFPYFCRMSADILRDGIYLTLLALFLLYLVRSCLQPTRLNSLCCGSWCMLGILNRFEALEAIFFFLTVPLILILQNRKKRFAVSFRIVMFFVLGMMVCLTLFSWIFQYPCTELLNMYGWRFVLYRLYVRI